MLKVIKDSVVKVFPLWMFVSFFLLVLFVGQGLFSRFILEWVGYAVVTNQMTRTAVATAFVFVSVMLVCLWIYSALYVTVPPILRRIRDAIGYANTSH